MTTPTTTRRTLLSGALALGAVALAPSRAAAAQDDQIDITVRDRSVSYSIWRPQAVRAAIVFSHGFGGRPQNYEALTTIYRDAGILIVAPMHVDSLDHPHRADYDRRAGFATRCEDMVAGFRILDRLAPDAPRAVSGHSYGALMSLLTGGGCPPLVAEPLAPVRAVVAFSSAGRLPGVIDEHSYGGLATPMLMVTGDQDTVEEYGINDWRDHLYPFETSPAGAKMALVYAGGNHNLIGGQLPAGAGGPDAMRIGADYILAYAASDADALARVDGLRTNAVREVLRR